MSRTRSPFGLILVALFGLGLSACGGGSQQFVDLLVPVTPAPAPIVPSQSAFSVTTTTAASASLAMPSAGGYSGSIALGSAPSAGTMVTQTLTDRAPLTIPPLSFVRKTSGIRTKLDVAPSQVLTYLVLSFTNTVAYTSAPGFSLTIPAAVLQPGTNYWLALYDPNRPSLGWQQAFEGPATISGTTLTFTGGSAITFVGNSQYWLAVYAVNPATAAPTAAPSISPLPTPTVMPTPTPTAAPTATPTPAPTPQMIVVNPTTINITTLGAPGATTFTASEGSYAGVLSAASSNTAVATVSPASGSSGATFTVTGIAAGTATINVTDTNNQTTAVTVTVTTGTVVIQ